MKNDPEGSIGAGVSERGGGPLLAPGRILDRYEIQRVLGVGGMSTVYEATQLSLKRKVAIKAPLARLAADPGFRARFERESEALAALDHPNIVNIIDRGQEGDLPYFVMEYVDGISLERAISKGLLSYADYIAIIRQTRDALGYIHGNGIVHLDLKPANILLGRRGRVKVSDFGIAAMAWEAVRAPANANSLLGTPRFMAPEQLQRKAVLDARTDIFALGVTFHLMFCGGFPENCDAQASKRNTSVPPAADRVLTKAIAQEPSSRYATVEQFCDDLLESLVGASAFHQLEGIESEARFGFSCDESSGASGSRPPADLVLELVHTTGSAEALAQATAPEDAEAIIGAGRRASAGASPAPAQRGGFWSVGVPLSIAAIAAAGALWLPSSQRLLSGGAAPLPSPSASRSLLPAAPSGPWAPGAVLPLPRNSYSFLALSSAGDLALATFNNRSLGSLPEEIPVLVVKGAAGPNPQCQELCSHTFASQRGYSGVAYGEDGALFVSADTGQPETSFVARYTPAGRLDEAFGKQGMLAPGKRCHGIDSVGDKLFVSVQSGELLILSAATGGEVATLPKALGVGIVRDVASDGATGRIFGIRSGGLVLWDPVAGQEGDFASYKFREVSPPDSLAPRALEGLCFSPSARRALVVPYKTAEVVEAAPSAAVWRQTLPMSGSEPVFADSAVSADGSLLFLSDVANMQIRLLRR